MKIAIKSTEAIVDLNGVPARVWLGITESGTKCKVFVHRVAVHNDDDADQFEKELKEQVEPGRVFDLRQILN